MPVRRRLRCAAPAAQDGNHLAFCALAPPRASGCRASAVSGLQGRH